MTVINIDGLDYEYECHPPHRNGANNKSQWIIPVPAEYDCFHDALTAGWSVGNTAWGFHEPNGVKQQLGVDRDHVTPAFIARFEAGNAPLVWHGYPIGRQDPPPLDILRDWLNNDVLPSAKIAKIAGRRKWSL